MAVIISKEPQTNTPNPTDAIASKNIMNQKSLVLLWRITWTPISLLTLAILWVISLILAMVMVRLCTRLASTLTFKQFYVKKNRYF